MREIFKRLITNFIEREISNIMPNSSQRRLLHPCEVVQLAMRFSLFHSKSICSFKVSRSIFTHPNHLVLFKMDSKAIS